MKKASIQALEVNLKRKSYSEIEQELSSATPHFLIRLLDSRSIKIGDSAAGLLRQRDCPAIISALEGNSVKTKLGKIRATNILFGCGRRFPEALGAYLAVLKDRNDEVADNALLGLVCWGDKKVIPAVKARGKKVKSGSNIATQFELACMALEKSNPNIFSPSFADDAGIWK